MRHLLSLLTAFSFICTSVASAQTNDVVFSRATLSDFSYTVDSGNPVTGGPQIVASSNGVTVSADFSNAVPGTFPFFGTGGGDNSGNVVNVVDPTIAGQQFLTVDLDLEAFGAANPASTYLFHGIFQFQDFGNTAGLNPPGTVNPQDVVNVQTPTIFYDGSLGGVQRSSVVIDLTSAIFDRGQISDVVTLLNAGELDNTLFNLQTENGTDFYGIDDTAGFTVSNVTVRQVLVSAVPEPSALALLGVLTIAGVGIRRRKL